VWDEHRCPGGPKGSDPLAYLGHARLTLALHGQRPSTEDGSHGHPEWKALRGRERDSGLCLLMHGRYVAAKLRDYSRPTPRKRQTIGMRQLLGQRQGLVEARQGLIRISQHPEGQRGLALAANARILAGADAECRGTTLVWRVACAAFLQVLA